MDNTPSHEELTQRIEILEQQLRDQQQQTEQNKLLSSVIHQCEEGVVVTDPSGKILIANDAFASMHGYAPGELLGAHFNILHPDEAQKVITLAEETLADKGSYEGRIPHLRKDKSTIITSQHNAFLKDVDGNPIGTIRRTKPIPRTRVRRSTRRTSLISKQ